MAAYVVLFLVKRNPKIEANVVVSECTVMLQCSRLLNYV